MPDYAVIIFFSLFVLLGGVAIGVISNDHKKKRRETRRERKLHNDADYHCRYWWGDRRESINAQCKICNPQGQDVLRG